MPAWRAVAFASPTILYSYSQHTDAAGPVSSSPRAEGKRPVPMPQGAPPPLEGCRQFPERRMETVCETQHMLAAHSGTMTHRLEVLPDDTYLDMLHIRVLSIFPCTHLHLSFVSVSISLEHDAYFLSSGATLRHSKREGIHHQASEQKSLPFCLSRHLHSADVAVHNKAAGSASHRSCLCCCSSCTRASDSSHGPLHRQGTPPRKQCRVLLGQGS